MADRGEVVFVALGGIGQRGPLPPLAVAPGVLREERDLRRAVAESERVVEVEVLELVGADDVFAALVRVVLLVGAVGPGDQLR